jgi:4-amino-4-deoxy-L-arabinose transferase-like glycosyltransferase
MFLSNNLRESKFAKALNKKIFFALFIAIIALASALFWTKVFPQGRPLTGDALEFHSLAVSLLDHGEFGGGEGFAKESPTMWREPGYPAFLAMTYAIAGKSLAAITIAQSILFALSSILLFYFLSSFASPITAGTASVLYASFPQLAYRAGYSGSDLPFVVSIIIFCWILSLAEMKQRKSLWLLTGIMAGIATLVRAVALLLPIPVILYLLFIRKKNKPLQSIIVFLLGFLIVVTPWMIRNKIYFDSFSISNRSGLMLHTRASHFNLSGHEYAEYFATSFFGDYFTSKLFPDYSPDVKRRVDGILSRDYEVELFQEGTPPSTIDKILMSAGLAEIKQHPFQYIVDFVPETARLNAPIIPRASSQAIFFPQTQRSVNRLAQCLIVFAIRGIMYIFLALVCMGIFARRKHAQSLWLFLIFIVLYFNIIYAAFAPVERFALPLYPFYFIFFLEGLRYLWKRSQT